jgi:hypothetical protein
MLRLQPSKRRGLCRYVPALNNIYNINNINPKSLHWYTAPKHMHIIAHLRLGTFITSIISIKSGGLVFNTVWSPIKDEAVFCFIPE